MYRYYNFAIDADEVCSPKYKNNKDPIPNNNPPCHQSNLILVEKQMIGLSGKISYASKPMYN